MSPCTLKLPSIVLSPSIFRLHLALRLPFTVIVVPSSLIRLSPIQEEVVNLGILFIVPAPPIPPEQPPAPNISKRSTPPEINDVAAFIVLALKLPPALI